MLPPFAWAQLDFIRRELEGNLCPTSLFSPIYVICSGGFLLVRDASGKYEVIDFRETAPAAADQDMYTKDPLLAQFGGLASGVPYVFFQPSFD